MYQIYYVYIAKQVNN